jgi:hypothetical protein
MEEIRIAYESSLVVRWYVVLWSVWNPDGSSVKIIERWTLTILTATQVPPLLPHLFSNKAASSIAFIVTSNSPLLIFPPIVSCSLPGNVSSSTSTEYANSVPTPLSLNSLIVSSQSKTLSPPTNCLKNVSRIASSVSGFTPGIDDRVSVDRMYGELSTMDGKEVSVYTR